MSCRRTREWLGTADPADLESPPKRQRRHLATCEACSRALDGARGAHAMLRRRLGEARSRITADEAVALALPDAGASHAARRPGARLPAGPGWRLAPVPVLALGLLLWIVWPAGPRPDARRAPRFQGGARPDAPELSLSGSSSAAAERAGFAVEAPAGSRLAVFETENPKIRVVWLYEPTRPMEGEPR